MDFRKLPAYIAEKWRAMTTLQKTSSLVALAAVLLAAFFLGRWFLTPQYAPLFANLQPQDAGAVVNKLKDMKVDYKLDNGGTTIMVPKDQVYDVRVQLASAGILESGAGAGFELFDKTQLGQTDFQQQVDYQRALQGELERTIDHINEVADARVHLVIPQESVFIQDQQPASAAVMLTLKPLQHLSAAQVRGIIYLVADSVQGLKPQDVTIVDNNGNILSNGALDSSANGSGDVNSQQELTRVFESQLQLRLQQFLDNVVGSGNAVVMVNAELNFDQQKTTSVTYQQGPLVSEQDKNSSSTGTAPGGPAGTASNSGGLSYPGGAGGNTSANDSETTKNWENNKTEQTTISAPGQVRRLSVSVLVDSSKLPSSWSNTDQANLQNALDNAVAAYNPLIKTPPTVQYLSSFNRKKPAAQPKPQLPYTLYIAVGAAVLVLLLAGIVMLIMRRRAARLAAGEVLDETIDDLVPVGELTVEKPKPVVLPPRVADEEEQAKTIVKEKPEDAAQILKVWLSEE